ncbi:dihydrouridine synthase [Streptomyces sp. SID12501]|uniref:Dihydrouridine synthase n=1 Tax=Streptomyces sp. SID12501 TaxID=2706042 RepID=A0A6B3BUM4_9ACTN|nr:dihydrouridine synthase [Streptomyces sp. SID12501]
MLLCIAMLVTGIALRQADRAHFARTRPRTADSTSLRELQRARANDLTPALLLIGQWVQITGWWLLAAQGPLAAVVTATAVGIHFRHLQEISHFAVHGVLARTRRANLLLAEIFAHHPLGLPPVTVRHRTHVRDHHPHATLDNDPNLAELHTAGLRPGVPRTHFLRALVFPLTPGGVRTTTADLLRNTNSWHRRAALFLLAVLAYTLGGWSGLVAGLLVPRLLLYPQLSWLSLLNEHTWFDPDPRTGTPTWIEAGRCLRLYPTNRTLAHLAATTWLPYGDLHHYAHSAHPAIRWNYLPSLERHLTNPHFTPNALLIGSGSVIRRHQSALTTPGTTTARKTQRLPL